METAKRKRLAIVIFLSILGVLLAGTFVLISVRGISIKSAFDEIAYIKLDTKRQNITYDLYRRASDFQVDLELIFDESNFESRAEKISELQIEGYALTQDFELLIGEYDLKLVDYDVNKSLRENAKEFYKLDKAIYTEVQNTVAYLDNDLAITKYLIGKKQVIDCYSAIVPSKEYDAIIGQYNSCYSRNSELPLPGDEFKNSQEYQDYLSTWLTKNIELYQALKAKAPDQADNLNTEIKSMSPKLQELNSSSNAELNVYLTQEYYRLIQQ